MLMRELQVVKHNFVLRDEIEIIYEKRVTRFGTSGKLDAPKKYIGKRAYVVVLKD
jgi:putative transposon-encoded protein